MNVSNSERDPAETTVRLVERIREGDPAAQEILAAMRLQLQFSHLKEANQLLAFAESVGADPSTLLLAQGNARFLAGDFAAAAERYRRAGEKRDGWISADKNLALTLMQLGEFELAAERWRSLLPEPRLEREARRQLASLELRE